jgi:hypothetical protein
MRAEDWTGPSYKDLRTLKPARTDTFPVHKNLVQKLIGAQTHPDDVIAHTMAVCAGYSYADGETLARMMTRLGLEKCRCRMISEYVDAMLITATSYVIQSEDGGVVILCYRGTPPTSVITWLTDLEIEPTRVSFPAPAGGGDHPEGDHNVHGGIYRNVRSTRYEIVRTLERAMWGRSVHADGAKVARPLEALYLVGHSLGGASAAMLAMMLRTDEVYDRFEEKLRAVYTFGQPMIASRDLALHCNEDEFLREKLIRYVYENDIVPQLPPKASGPFRHFGKEHQYRAKAGGWVSNAKPRKQLSNLLAIFLTPLSFVARQLRLTRNIRFNASIVDHFPQYYIETLTPEDVRSEFGD